MSARSLYQFHRYLGISLILLFGSPSGFSQTDASRMFSKYTTANGLLINSIYDVQRSRNGMWWIGTGAGLQRFDGYSFQNWTENADSKTVNSASGVQRIYEDSLGNVWVFNFNVLTVFPAGKRKYERISVDPSKQIAYPNVYLLPLFEQGGRIWCFEGNTGIYGINQQSKLLDTIIPLVFKTDAPSLGSASIPFVCRDEEGSAWISQDLPDTNYLVHFIPGKIPVIKSLSVKEHGRLKAFIPLGNDRFLFLSTMYAAICNGDDPAKSLYIITRENIPGNFIRMFPYEKLKVYHKGNILFSGEKGLYEFDAGTRTISPYATSAYPDFNLNRQFLFALKEDLHGNIWMGRDASDGLLIFYPGKLKFTFSKAPEPYFNIVYSLAAAGNGQLISAGYQKGLNLFSSGGDWIKYIDLPKTEDGLTMSIRAMNFIDPEHLLMKSLFGKMAVLNMRDHSVTDISHLLPYRVAIQRNAFDANFVRASENKLQFVHGNYLLTVEKRENQYAVSVIDSLADVDRLTVSMIASGGQTLLGSVKGLYIKNDNRWVPIRGTEGVYIKHLVADQYGAIWAASTSGVLVIKNNQIVHKYDESTGLLNHFVYGILFDNDGNAWYSSNKGLGCILKDGSLKFFTTADGIQGDEFDTQSFWKGNEGRLYFGGTNGITSFYPQDVLGPGTDDRAILSALQVNGNSYPEDGRVEDLHGLVLPYDQNALSFSFSLADVSDPGYVVYQSRMDGFDKDWVNLKNVHSTSYLLPHGSYTLRIRGSKDGSRWSQELVFPIVIQPAWWQTGWFNVFAGMIILGVLFGAFWFYGSRRTERLRQQLLLKEEMEKERDRISRDLHDNIGAYSTAMIANTDSLEPLMNTEQSREKLSHLKDNARNILSAIRETIWLLNSKNLNVRGFTDGFMNYSTNILRNYEGVEIEFSDEIFENKGLSPAVAINLLRILQELVQNILKHSQATMIWCDVKSNEEFSITIRDNGEGFDLDTIIAGNGLSNMRSRARDIGFSLNMKSVRGSGTVAVVSGKI